MNRKIQEKINDAMRYCMGFDHKHVNCFRINPKIESPLHIQEKYKRWLYYRNAEIPVMTEVTFLNNQRADILLPVWKQVVEILVSETDERFEAKDYPFKIIKVRVRG